MADNEEFAQILRRLEYRFRSNSENPLKGLTDEESETFLALLLKVDNNKNKAKLAELTDMENQFLTAIKEGQTNFFVLWPLLNVRQRKDAANALTKLRRRGLIRNEGTRKCPVWKPV